MLSNTGLLLHHFARLAASNADTSAAVVSVSGGRRERGPRRSFYGLSNEQSAAVVELDRAMFAQSDLTIVPDLSLDPRFAARAAAFESPRLRFFVHMNLLSSSGDRIGFICLMDEHRRDGLTAEQLAFLNEIGETVIADRRREQRHQHLMHVADRALRVDRMLRVVSDAASTADALKDLLEELCVFHGAKIGRIFQLVSPNEPLLQVSRYRHNAMSHDDIDPLIAFGDDTVAAIRANTPYATEVFRSNEVQQPPVGAASRPSCYVCIPIWVQQQRFGISMLFHAAEVDPDAVVADVSSLADSIRPALFRKVTEERLHHAAHHDDLTQLCNRLMFHERLRKTLAVARSAGPGFALLYLDLDGFKLVNDTRGHEVGDRLLVSVAERLRETVRSGDTVARMGGDEFAIIQQFEGEASSAAALAERVLEAIAQPFELSGRRSLIGVSIGIAIFPQHGENQDDLLRNADIALYQAKRGGRNGYRMFEPEMLALQHKHFIIEQDVREAIETKGFKLVYQPVCDSRSLRIIGFEALLRWTSPAAGPVQPDRFIPLAESTGLIVPLGQWALEEACTEAATWDPPLSLSVNLSPLQFRQRDLAQQIADVLQRTGLPAHRLELEVTEGLLLDDSELVLRTMRQLQEQGIRITLDDFGTAYASLSYLCRFPFNGIKIDRSFVQGLGDRGSSLAIVEAILRLSDRLCLTVVAEGVETEQELQALRTIGCRLIQGYLSGRPADSEQTRKLLQRA